MTEEMLSPSFTVNSSCLSPILMMKLPPENVMFEFTVAFPVRVEYESYLPVTMLLFTSILPSVSPSCARALFVPLSLAVIVISSSDSIFDVIVKYPSEFILALNCPFVCEEMYDIKEARLVCLPLVIMSYDTSPCVIVKYSIPLYKKSKGTFCVPVRVAVPLLPNDSVREPVSLNSLRPVTLSKLPPVIDFIVISPESSEL